MTNYESARNSSNPGARSSWAGAASGIAAAGGVASSKAGPWREFAGDPETAGAAHGQSHQTAQQIAATHTAATHNPTFNRQGKTLSH